MGAPMRLASTVAVMGPLRTGSAPNPGPCARTQRGASASSDLVTAKRSTLGPAVLGIIVSASSREPRGGAAGGWGSNLDGSGAAGDGERADSYDGSCSSSSNAPGGRPDGSGPPGRQTSPVRCPRGEV